MSEPTNKRAYYYTYDTDFGKILLASTDKGLCFASFLGEDMEEQFNWLKKYFDEGDIIEDEDKNREAWAQLKEYFSGNREKFNLRFDLLGTPFQTKVWNILSEIKYSEIWTYKDVACRLGDIKKSRAVGGAVGKNPIVIIIPCHRVIGSNGKLTGFSSVGGLDLKKKLLDLENKNSL